MRKQTMLFHAVKLAASFWRKACLFDSIPANSSFVIFSRHNPYIRAFNRATSLIIRLKGNSGNRVPVNFNVRPFGIRTGGSK